MEQNHSKNIHVVARDGKWVVRGESTAQVKSIHKTQYDAINTARKIARSEKAELVIHGLDGRIRERSSYSSEPLDKKIPPKVLFPRSIDKNNELRIKRAVIEVIQERQNTSG